jgi:hypothetical protein
VDADPDGSGPNRRETSLAADRARKRRARIAQEARSGGGPCPDTAGNRTAAERRRSDAAKKVPGLKENLTRAEYNEHGHAVAGKEVMQMTKLQEAIRLYEEAMRVLARSRTVSERMKTKNALQKAFDLIVSAVGDSGTWTAADEAAFAAFTARWES